MVCAPSCPLISGASLGSPASPIQDRNGRLPPATVYQFLSYDRRGRLAPPPFLPSRGAVLSPAADVCPASYDRSHAVLLPAVTASLCSPSAQLGRPGCLGFAPRPSEPSAARCPDPSTRAAVASESARSTGRNAAHCRHDHRLPALGVVTVCAAPLAPVIRTFSRGACILPVCGPHAALCGCIWPGPPTAQSRNCPTPHPISLLHCEVCTRTATRPRSRGNPSPASIDFTAAASATQSTSASPTTARLRECGRQSGLCESKLRSDPEGPRP